MGISLGGEAGRKCRWAPEAELQHALPRQMKSPAHNPEMWKWAEVSLPLSGSQRPANDGRPKLGEYLLPMQRANAKGSGRKWGRDPQLATKYALVTRRKELTCDLCLMHP